MWVFPKRFGKYLAKYALIQPEGGNSFFEGYVMPVI